MSIHVGWLPVVLLVGAVLGHVMAGVGSRDEELFRALDQHSERLLQELPARVAMAQDNTRCASSAPGSPVDLTPLRADLERLVREELSRKAGAPRQEEPPKEPAPREPEPAAMEALQRGQRLIDDALAARRWGEEQAQTLRLLLAEMTLAQRAEVKQRLVVAINRGELKVDLRGPPF